MNWERPGIPDSGSLEILALITGYFRTESAGNIVVAVAGYDDDDD